MSPFYTVRTIALAAAAALMFQPAFGQGTQAPQPTTTTPPAAGNIPGGTPAPGRTTTPRTQDPTQQSPTNTPWPEIQRPIFISGKVVVDDGTPPPESVVIERVCNGVQRPEGYTDSKGRFQFELGRNNAMFADASVGSSADASNPSFGNSRGMNSGVGGMGQRGGGISERDLMGCEIRAVLPGYRSESITLANHRMFDNPDIGTILLHHLGKVEGRIISATTLNAPKDAKKAYEKGQDLLKKKKPEEAVKSFEKAVDVYPKFATAWYELGKLQERDNQLEAAAKSYQQSIAADSKYIQPYLQLAGIAARQRNWKDLADTTERAIKLDPFDYPQAHFYNAVANYNLKNLEAAEKSARETIKLDTRHEYPKAGHLLGILLADRRDYSGAAEQMRSYLKFAPRAQDAEVVRNQLIELEKLTGGAVQTKPEPRPE